MCDMRQLQSSRRSLLMESRLIPKPGRAHVHRASPLTTACDQGYLLLINQPLQFYPALLQIIDLFLVIPVFHDLADTLRHLLEFLLLLRRLTLSQCECVAFCFPCRLWLLQHDKISLTLVLLELLLDIFRVREVLVSLRQRFHSL